jgi:hypothetical protein
MEYCGRRMLIAMQALCTRYYSQMSIALIPQLPFHRTSYFVVRNHHSLQRFDGQWRDLAVREEGEDEQVREGFFEGRERAYTTLSRVV